MPDNTIEKPKKTVTSKWGMNPKWSMNQDDHIELLKSVDTNAKAINTLIANVETLMADVKRVKIRMGI